MLRWLVLLSVLACGGSPATPMVTPASPSSPMAEPAPVPPATDEHVTALIQHNLARVNAYRAQAGVPALVLDDRLSAFARTAAHELSAGGPPHGHLKAHNAEIRAAIGARLLFENQGKRGGRRAGVERDAMMKAHVDQILQGMMDEGPGGGHHDAIMNPALRRIGIGIVLDGNRLTLTNDFAD